MCRNIKTIYNFDPPATETEIRDAALQFVRKISGFRSPSHANAKAFTHAVDRVSSDIHTLFSELTTDTPPKNRETEMLKSHARAKKRFASNTT